MSRFDDYDEFDEYTGDVEYTVGANYKGGSAVADGGTYTPDGYRPELDSAFIQNPLENSRRAVDDYPDQYNGQYDNQYNDQYDNQYNDQYGNAFFNKYLIVCVAFNPLIDHKHPSAPNRIPKITFYETGILFGTKDILFRISQRILLRRYFAKPINKKWRYHRQDDSK